MRVLLMYPPSPAHRAALEEAAPGVEIRVASSAEDAARHIAGADAVLGNRYFLQSLPRARRLRWMQSNSMGMDLVLSAGELLDGVAVTSVRGVYDDEVAEHALALALALLRDLHRLRDDQRERRWTRRPLARLSESRALVLGWGGVGVGIARRLAALGVRVEGVRRSHRGAAAGDSTGFPVWGPDRWRDRLPHAELLFLALPLTPDTRCLVGRAELAALPHHARVINVGRGGTIDQAALLEALAAGRLGGAALDVLEEEPPSPDFAGWAEPRLIVTPHVARSMELPPHRWEPLFVENLRRFAAGEPLCNVVSRELGY
ncbi:MAG TPA: NAD(P)-dependent oxidoreductase [Longimicrobium sp.]|jgi:phosphoglycerate dehydrogenase-like enzyme